MHRIVDHFFLKSTLLLIIMDEKNILNKSHPCQQEGINGIFVVYLFSLSDTYIRPTIKATVVFFRFLSVILFIVSIFTVRLVIPTAYVNFCTFSVVYKNLRRSISSPL